MIRARIFSLAGALLILGIWEVACRLMAVPDFILPPPSQIITVAVARASILLPHAGVTALEVVIGIVLSLFIAIPLSMIMFAHPATAFSIAG